MEYFKVFLWLTLTAAVIRIMCGLAEGQLYPGLEGDTLELFLGTQAQTIFEPDGFFTSIPIVGSWLQALWNFLSWDYEVLKNGFGIYVRYFFQALSVVWALMLAGFIISHIPVIGRGQ